MKFSILSKEVLPLLVMFGSLLVATAITDALLHLFGLMWIGRYLGIPGTILILLSFFYSMRKRKLIEFGKPKGLLRLHEVLTWLGALMIMVHAGIHVYAILPWLALLAMLITLASGMTGRYLLDRSRRQLKSQRDAYEERGLTGKAVDKEVFWDSVTVDLMKQWRAVHFPITLAFGVLGLTHILSIFLYWQWK
ncbi:hypothetical protein [Thiorhodovibrio frisius]|uniref:Ferric reductase like transmembrane component n=1 Tax=Thiorhodovibrio frisius TaxID=631362 RepID=H8Z7F4_9GAMM|nr:hypothetical protein [Thiorhodovibrio frisius]EIC20884.1 hypothetical protein Thi970DRAFT_04553 [Thiorhodovibrio frisius]WPL21939.1 hypothetical protein Thiofri_02079 [Thiorhodovibrio frisius]